MRRSTHLIAITIAIFSFTEVCPAQPSTQPVVLKKTSTGTITYPAVDNIDFKEGTIECWVKFAFEPADYLPRAEYQGLVALLSVSGESGSFNVHFGAQPNSAAATWWCSIGPKTIFTPFGITTEPTMKKDEWRHIAVVWKENQMTAYVDGKKAGGATFQSTLYKGFGAPAGDKPIMIGDKWGYGGLVTIDEFRLSRVARAPEELGASGQLKPDAHTAILDSFDDDFVPDGKTRTKPAKILAGDGGLPSVPAQFVAEGKFGKGLALFSPGK